MGMSNVKKLNCWGAELTDVSVLRKLVNVEVLSLSVNCITTLADIQNCKNLQELYISKNKISDLNEVCWLRGLTKLKNLWLEENPCCNQTQSDLYRATVIRNLPQLQKLDNVIVQPDEVADAMRRGIELIHPYDQDESIPYTNYAPPPGPPVPTYQQGGGYQMVRSGSTGYMDDGYVPDYHTGRKMSASQYESQQGSRRASKVSQHSMIAEESLRRMSIHEDERNANSYNQSRSNSVQGPQDSLYHDQPPPRNAYARSNSEPTKLKRSPSNESKKSSRFSSKSKSQGSSSIKEIPTPNEEEEEESCKNCSTDEETQTPLHFRSLQLDSSPRNKPQLSPTNSNDAAKKCMNCHNGGTSSPSSNSTTSSSGKNSNILSAVLCLIKELDAPSLEV